MSNRNKTMKKNKKSAERKACLLAAIALSAALFGGQLPMETLPVYALESQDDTPGSVIPDNITIDQPMALADIGLPELLMEHWNGLMEVMCRTGECSPALWS